MARTSKSTPPATDRDALAEIYLNRELGIGTFLSDRSPRVVRDDGCVYELNDWARLDVALREVRRFVLLAYLIGWGF